MYSPKKNSRALSTPRFSDFDGESRAQSSNEHSVSVSVDLKAYCQVVYDYQQAQEPDKKKELKDAVVTLRAQLIYQYASALAGDFL